MPTAVALRALLVLALLLAPLVPGRAFAQDPAPECDTGDCAPRGAGQGSSSDELAQSAARIRQARTDFVLSLRHLLEALPGTYGDEGPALRAATAGMAEALRRWDRAIRAYQTPLEKVTGQADVHVALGTVLLERGRAKQAVEEFTAASRLAPDRAPVFLLLGLAFDAAGRHADAAKAFTRAATLPPGNAVAAYAVRSSCANRARPGLPSKDSKPFTARWSRNCRSRRCPRSSRSRVRDCCGSRPGWRPSGRRRAMYQGSMPWRADPMPRPSRRSTAP